MSDIDIRHPHAMPAKQVRKAVEQVAGKLSERFGLDCNWEGDTLHFHRSGVDGHIAMESDQVHIRAKLGFLLAAMKGPIEQEIRRVLAERFS